MQTPILLDNLDPKTLAMLEAEARRHGLEVSMMAAQLLKEGLQAHVCEESPQRRRDLSDLAGTWTDEEADEFLAAVADFERIDWDMWK